MDDAFLQILRCPIDPQRATELLRERDVLVCKQCDVRYPLKQGIPNLVYDEAALPDGCRERSQLPCHRRYNKKINRGR